MKIRSLLFCLGALTLSSCATYDGGYSPSCPTFVANVVQLENGGFTWTKLSDEVVIGDDGQPVDRYPDFPKRGAYEVRAGVLTMTTTDGEALPPMYFHESGEQLYLLTGVEFRTMQQSGKLPDCALLRAGQAGEN
ncbi:MAG: hypothetical protein QNJ07_01630 [Woeseiaceae bacterium]|nr:hypothetical protein [Woeseiaceae bacterium]